MDRLIEGYRRFRAEVWPEEKARYRALAQRGQSPETAVIACSDSRVDPQIVFGAQPGELFVIRNVAGLVPPYEPDAGYHGTSAALEYAVRVLQVGRIVVLGHDQCGGVRALVQGAPDIAKDFVEPWVRITRAGLSPTPEGPVPDEILHHYEEQVVRLTLANLATFPWIRSAVEEGRLALYGCKFAIYTGVLSRLEGEHFVPVS